MKFARATLITMLTLFTLLAIPLRLAAQQAHPHFKFRDLGTLGGPQSSLFGGSQVINSNGVVAFGGDTSISDPNYPNYNPLLGQDPFIQHAIRWHKGVKTDLGTLPGGWSSYSGWITDNGLNSGIAEDGSIDPVTGWPATHAVLWQKHKIVDMGTLPGGYEAGATAVNSAGQAAGFASNTITDQYSFFGWGTQSRAFRWTASEGMKDIGDLGGPDAAAWLQNEVGQIAGQSYINSTPNSYSTECGSKVPTVDTFLWDKGIMNDLPRLGGLCSAANGINSSGQVAGFSYANALYPHAVLWSMGNDGKYALQDLGDFGAPGSKAFWINDAGEVVGYAQDQNHFNRAFLWTNGTLMNLGSLNSDTCSAALGINSKTQIIGNSGDCHNFVSRPFLWQSGSIYDLSTAFPPSHFMAAEAEFINSDGEVAGVGTLPNGDHHAYVLIPCKAGTKGCKRVTAGVASRAAAMTQNSAPMTLPGPNRLGRLYQQWGVSAHKPQ